MLKSFISAFSILFLAITSSGVSEVNAQVNDDLMPIVQHTNTSRLPANTDDIGEDPNMRMHRTILPSVTEASLNEGQHIFISKNPSRPFLRGRLTTPDVPTAVVAPKAPVRKSAPSSEDSSGTGN